MGGQTETCGKMHASPICRTCTLCKREQRIDDVAGMEKGFACWYFFYAQGIQLPAVSGKGILTADRRLGMGESCVF